MPPQQFQRLLEVLSNGFDLGAHGAAVLVFVGSVKRL